MLKKVGVFPRVQGEVGKKQASRVNPFYFCDKETGMTRFRSEADSDQAASLERIASQLAMHCLVRGHEPEDFVVLVPAGSSLVEALVSRANELLREGRAISNPPNLSTRQKEILQSVLCNHANKEIASRFNITVRTVKFHISSLLEKFDVENRTELAQRAAGILRPTPLEREKVSPGQLAAVTERRRELGPVPVHASYRVTAKGRSVRFPGRVLTA